MTDSIAGASTGPKMASLPSSSLLGGRHMRAARPLCLLSWKGTGGGYGRALGESNMTSPSASTAHGAAATF